MTSTDTGTPSISCRHERFTGDGVTESRAVAVGCVTLQTGDYDDAGIVAAETTHLSVPGVKACCVSATIETVRETYPGDGEAETVAIKTVIGGHDFDFQTATSAFYRLAGLNNVEFLYLADRGLCLEVNG
jgi:hypothetical protein